MAERIAPIEPASDLARHSEAKPPEVKLECGEILCLFHHSGICTPAENLIYQAQHRHLGVGQEAMTFQVKRAQEILQSGECSDQIQLKTAIDSVNEGIL